MFRITASLVFCVALVPVLEVAASSSRDWSVGVYGEASEPAVSFEDMESEANSPSYRTNTQMAPGMSVRYKHYSVSFGTPVTGTSRRDPLRPPTRLFDLRLAWLSERWGVETYSQYFRGFFVENSDRDSILMDNSSASITSWNTNLYGALGSWSRVDRMRDGLAETGVRLNVYGLLGATYQRFRSPVPFLDTLAEGEGAPYEFMSRLSHTSLAAGAGATLNTNLFGLYCDPTMMIAFGPQYREANTDLEPWGAVMKLHLKLQAGYANDSWNIGMAVENDANGVDLSERYFILFHSIAVRFFATMSF